MEKAPSVQIPICAKLMPDYYPAFQCIGEQCQDSCCCGWQITLSKKDYTALRRVPATGELSGRLEGALHRFRGQQANEKKYAELQMKGERCPLLHESGLCALQREQGHQALPEVCQEFPRSISYTPAGTREHACSTGCEEVLRLLYQRPEGLSFLWEDVSAKEQKLVNFFDLDEIQKHFGPIRELCIDILQDRTMSLPLRLLMLGWVLRDLGERAQDTEPWAVLDWVEQRRAFSQTAELRDQLERLSGNQAFFVGNQVKQLLFRPNLSESACALRDEIFCLLGVVPVENEGRFQIDFPSYAQAEQRFFTNYGDLDYFFENILVNIFFQFKYPLHKGAKQVWQEYVSLCNNYGSLRFLAICGCQGSENIERLFHVLTQGSRMLLHNASMQMYNTHKLMSHGNDTLADMAILVRG